MTNRRITTALLAALIGALTGTPAAHAEEAAGIVANLWERYRSVRTETETVDIAIVSAPPAAPVPRAQVEALLQTGGPGIRPKRATRRVTYAADHQDKMVIVFGAPAEDVGTAFLVWRKAGRDQDEQWLYMPSLGRVRRIAVTSSQSFVGTNMRYEDIRELAGERVDNYSYELLPAEAQDGRPCTVIQATPNPGVTSAYKRRKMWLDQAWQIPVKVEYYDARDVLWKVLYQSSVTQLPSGIYRADLLEVRDLQLQEATFMLISKREVAQALSPETFTTDYLERAGADL